MHRSLAILAPLVLAVGCASSAPPPDSLTRELRSSDVTVAGWQTPAECGPLHEKLSSARQRWLSGMSFFSSSRGASDERRIRSLAQRSKALGCPEPTSY